MMAIGQVISMLMAAQAQGATKVMVAQFDPLGHPVCSDIDWISPAPVDGVVYVRPMPDHEVLSNEAAESVDM